MSGAKRNYFDHVHTQEVREMFAQFEQSLREQAFIDKKLKEYEEVKLKEHLHKK